MPTALLDTATPVTVANTTVVVPVWDEYVAELLPDALQSVERQDRTPEIVVVDNASKIAVPELAGVSVVHASRRLTLGAARNMGLAQVKTPYVLFWDADDVMVPGTIAFLEQEIANAPGVVAFAAAIIEDPSGKRHRHPRRWAPLLMRAPSLFALLHCVWSLYPTTGATIIHTDVARAAGGFADADSGEDWCLGVSLAFRGRIAFGARPGRLYRLHERSMWALHMTPRHQLRHARSIRERVANDSAIPRWVNRLLPVIALAQWAAILAHLALEAVRRAQKLRRPA
jgi:glycosyltransferase involved in cell wall biosynthesis